MKKVISLLIILFALNIFIPTVSANMAAPLIPSHASTITFEKNDDISVLSETLNIIIDTPRAKIEAIYLMKNQRDFQVSTPSMFISPNIIDATTVVLINDKEVKYDKSSYYFDSSKVEKDLWEFKIIENEFVDEGNLVDAINFQLDFEANEELKVVVSYYYLLGGRPNNTSNLRYAELNYFLAPCNLWQNFSELEINLYLDDELPKLDEANLDFIKIDDKIYQYKDNKIPKENLEIRLDQSAFIEFFTRFNNPYFLMTLLMFSPIIILGIVFVITLIIFLRKIYKIKRGI